jgi:hypothetical protein
MCFDIYIYQRMYVTYNQLFLFTEYDTHLYLKDKVVSIFNVSIDKIEYHR